MLALITRVTAVSAAMLVAAAVTVLAISDPETDPQVIADSVDRAWAAGTARSVFSFTIDAPPGFEERAASFGGEADFDFARERSRAAFQFTAAMGGDGASPDTPAEMQMEVFLDRGDLLLRMPALRAAVPAAPSDWFSLDLEELSQVTGEQSLGLGATDPTQTLEYLRGASTEVERVGDEPVGDVDTTHYRADLDLRRAVALTPEARRPLVEDAVEQFVAQFGATTFPVDVWIDEDGLPRRVRFELDLSEHDGAGKAPKGAIMSFTMELSHFGEALEIPIPPRDQVADLTTLLATGAGPRPSTAGG